MESYNEWRHKNQTQIDFFEDRKKWAKRMAQEARAAHQDHSFWCENAKDFPYQQVLNAIRGDSPKSFYNAKFREELSKIHGQLTQKEFQEASGRMNVWAESLIKLFR